MGKLMTEMKYEIKDEIVKEVRKDNEKIRKEMKIENEKLKADYDTKLSSLSGKLESVEIDNANLLKKNAVLCTRIKEMEGKIESVEQMSIDSIRKGNWNEQYSRKKNLRFITVRKEGGDYQLRCSKR
jgi:predicted nuclease with TOPRIM domain